MPLHHVQAGSKDQLQDIADALWKAKKVIVITGAGISTNSGIPDFRSENGLYAMIQSQFDAASKLGFPKDDLATTASEERPRKRRRTTPPIQDSIEVAADYYSTDPISPPEDTIIVTNTTESVTTVEDDTITASTSNSGSTCSRLQPGTKDCIEPLDAIDDECVLLPQNTVSTNESRLHGGDTVRKEDATIKNEEPEPPGDLVEESSNIVEGEQHSSSQAPQTTPYALSLRRSSRRNTPVPETLFATLEPPEDCQAQQPATTTIAQFSQHAPAPNSGPQTTTSSPLSSPPTANLFDSFNEQLTDQPPSSSRPSSPVSTENDEDDKSNGMENSGGEAKNCNEDRNNEEDDIEPSWSQDYVNRSSTFRRSLSTLKGKELFDASIWSDPLKTSVFYTFATNLRQKSRDAAPTGCHQFIGHLSKAGKMVRCYTQNIDLLEDKVGLSTRLLLGAGSRSRFSTRGARGSAVGPKDLTQNDTQSTPLPSVPCAGTSSEPAVDPTTVDQEATPSNSQVAPPQLLEETVHSVDRGLVEGNSEQGQHDGERENHGPNIDAQPIDANAKALPTTDGSCPTTLEHDRGVECVFLHGSLRALRCFQCGSVADWEGDRELQTMSGQQPPCPRCEDATNARQERGKRALGVGKLRPDIVLYGEDHPEAQQISNIIQHDISLAPDMLIIMGTSLKVHGLKTVVREFAKTVHNRKDGKVIFVNYTRPAESVWADTIDFWVEMDCDSWVEDLKEKKPIIWMPPGSVEDETRTTTTKRRRPVTDDAEAKEMKRTKKTEDALAAAAKAKNKSKNSKPVKKAELPKPEFAKPAVPKRPAAFRDCKHNAAYWVNHILDDLARMTGRERPPAPPPYQPSLATQDADHDAPQSVPLVVSGPASSTAAPIKTRRGPRTKNTKSRKEHEAVVTSSLPEDKSTVKNPTLLVASTPKAPVKRRVRKPRPATAAKTREASTMSALSLKRDPEATPASSVLAEVPVPNTGPVPNTESVPTGPDVPMISVVKNRTRKPKIFFGEESNPGPGAPVSMPARRETPIAVNARSNARGVSQSKKSKQHIAPNEFPNSEITPQTELRHLPALVKPQPPRLHVPIQLSPLNIRPEQAIDRRRHSFYKAAKAPGQPDSPEVIPPPPDYLEPVPVLSPHYLDDMLPKLSPNHWKKRAYSFSNALFRSPLDRSPLDFNNLRSNNAGVAPPMYHPIYVTPQPEQPEQQMGYAMQQQTYLQEAPRLMAGYMTSLPDPAVSSAPGGDINWQLQKEEEDAAAVLSQLQFDNRHLRHVQEP